MDWENYILSGNTKIRVGVCCRHPVSRRSQGCSKHSTMPRLSPLHTRHLYFEYVYVSLNINVRIIQSKMSIVLRFRTIISVQYVPSFSIAFNDFGFKFYNRETDLVLFYVNMFGGIIINTSLPLVTRDMCKHVLKVNREQ